MGNKPPNLIKTVYTGQSELPFHYCCSYVRGCRNEQEDAHTLAKLLEYKKKKSNASFFGVFDGHSGAGTSNYVANNLLTKYLLSEEDDPKQGEQVKEVTENSTDEEIGEFLTDDNRIIRKFLKCEHDIVFDEKDNLGNSGSAGVSVFLKYKKNEKNFEFVCANVGDSRAVFYDAGEIKELSQDHKPSNKNETKRIQEAGHYVVSDRVDGQLALSRSFGDKKYKTLVFSPEKQVMRNSAVIAEPEIRRATVSLDKPVKDAKSPYKFMIMCCDGVWDVFKNQEVCEFVAKLMEQFDIFNPEVKIPANYHDSAFLNAAKKKGDDWAYTAMENWTENQYQQWEHTIPNPYPVFSNVMNIHALARIVKEYLTNNEPTNENQQQREKYKKVFTNMMELKKNHDAMEKRMREQPFLTTVEEKLQKIVEILIDEVVVVRGSSDNVSVVIVLLDNHEKVNEFPKTKTGNFDKVPQFDLIDLSADSEKKKKREEFEQYLVDIGKILGQNISFGSDKPAETATPAQKPENELKLVKGDSKSKLQLNQ